MERGKFIEQYKGFLADTLMEWWNNVMPATSLDDIRDTSDDLIDAILSFYHEEKGMHGIHIIEAELEDTLFQFFDCELYWFIKEATFNRDPISAFMDIYSDLCKIIQ